jgi:hypothetical protein
MAVVRDKLNILVLHSLGNVETAPLFLRHHVFQLQQNCGWHNYLYHDTALPLPEYVRNTAFDVIILDVTFLYARWSAPRVLSRLQNQYQFVKYSNAVKIAFPQDEYDCNEILDDWMCDWNVDVVYSVISEHWDVLYPKFHKKGEIRLGFTGYVNESLIDRRRKRFADRTIDIGYRAKKLLPYFGRLGETKWTIGRDVDLLAKNAGLNVDISLGDKSTLFGEAWLDFIDNSKFTLGANSGSSLLDPRGLIQHGVRNYFLKRQDATFEEVEELFFKGLDGKYSFTAISPRVMEAALLDSCQILVEGSYSNILSPHVHYIPIKSDASDFGQVLEAMKDVSSVNRMIGNCRSTILDTQELRGRNMALKVLDLAKDKVSRKNVQSSVSAVEQTIQRYRQEMTPQKYAAVWKNRRLRQSVVSLLHGYPKALRLARGAYSFLNGRTWR